MAKPVIIGAGLSGLTSAYFLQTKGIDSLILEARGHTGGRIETIRDGSFHCEMGATWLGPQHTVLLSLFEELEIEKFEQYYEGYGIVDYGGGHPPYQFKPNENDPPTFRMTGGSETLIKTLVNASKADILYNTKVQTIQLKGDKLILDTNNDQFETGVVISTIPPKLTSKSINFDPPLASVLLKEMDKTHTWMSNSIKFSVSYATPFWRDKGFSGTLMSPQGPVIEMYDHSTREDSAFGIMGFLSESLRSLSESDRKDRVLKFLSDYFGEQIFDYLHYYEKDWSTDTNTTTSDFESIQQHPHYNSQVYQQDIMDGRLILSGTETSMHYPGYMEGAVFSGIKSAQRALQVI